MKEERNINSAWIVIIDSIGKDHISQVRIALIEMFGWNKQPGEINYNPDEFETDDKRFSSGIYDYSINSADYVLQFEKKLTFPKGTRNSMSLHGESIYFEEIIDTARREIAEELLIFSEDYTILPYELPIHKRETWQSRRKRKENPDYFADIKHTKLYIAELTKQVDIIKPDADFENEIKRAVWVPWWIGESFFKYQEDSDFYREYIQPVIEKHLQTKWFSLE